MRHSHLILIFSLGLCHWTCGVERPSKLRLILQETYKVEFKEPSGLSAYTRSHLISVSDHDGMAYIIDTLGRSIQSIDLGAKDLEGVSYDTADSLIYVVDESDGKLRCFTTAGALVDAWTILEGGEDGSLEGCSLDGRRKVMYLLKEKSPGRLIVRDMLTGRQQSIPLDFAKDYSGIFYDEKLNRLWIISHESKSVNLCTLDGQMELSFSIDAKQAEGIVVDHDSRVIYIMSDSQGKLFKYQLPAL